MRYDYSGIRHPLLPTVPIGAIVISSPSGAGKSTLIQYLLNRFQDDLRLSVSFTTRVPREGEVDGREYTFVDKNNFVEQINNGVFLEYAELFGSFYGTRRDTVEEYFTKGYGVIFDVDWHGAQALRKELKDLISIFILPPSLAVLEERLLMRGKDSKSVVRSRMDEALCDISHWSEYDYVLINSDLDMCKRNIESLIVSSVLKRQQKDISNFVEGIFKEREPSK